MQEPMPKIAEEAQDLLQCHPTLQERVRAAAVRRRV